MCVMALSAWFWLAEDETEESWKLCARKSAGAAYARKATTCIILYEFVGALAGKEKLISEVWQLCLHKSLEVCPLLLMLGRRCIWCGDTERAFFSMTRTDASTESHEFLLTQRCFSRLRDSRRRSARPKVHPWQIKWFY